MADITMCSNEECISADFCERKTATPNRHRQSVAWFCGKGNGWVKCEMYSPNEKAKVFDILSHDRPSDVFRWPDFSEFSVQSISRALRIRPKDSFVIVDYISLLK